jgi:hypothetical protein
MILRKLLSLTLAASFALPASLAAAAPAAAPDASCAKAVDKKLCELEYEIVDFYAQYPGDAVGVDYTSGKAVDIYANPYTDPRRDGGARAEADAVVHRVANPVENSITNESRAVYALDIFDEIALLPTDSYNKVIAFLGVDYRQHPEHRTAIERLLASLGRVTSDDPTSDMIRAKLREEIGNSERYRAQPGQSMVYTVIDGVLVGLIVAHSIQGIRGALAAGEEGLTRLASFKSAVARVVKHLVGLGAKNDAKTLELMKQFKEMRLVAADAGLAGGLIKAMYNEYSTVKISPARALQIARADIVHEDGVAAAKLRDALKAAAAQSDSQLGPQAAAIRKMLDEADAAVSRMQPELKHLFNVAQELRPKMDPIAQDLTQVRSLAQQIGLRLDQIEISGSAPN